MATFTDDQCNDLLSIRTQKRYKGDGTTFKDFVVRVYDENDSYYEWLDTTSAAGSIASTRETAAKAYLKTNCEFKPAAISTMDAPIDLLS